MERPSNKACNQAHYSHQGGPLQLVVLEAAGEEGQDAFGLRSLGCAPAWQHLQHRHQVVDDLERERALIT